MSDVRQSAIENRGAGKGKSAGPARNRLMPGKRPARPLSFDADVLVRQLDAKIAMMADMRRKIRGPRKEQH